MAIALSGSLILSGSITVSGSIISTGTISMSGSIASASYANNATTASYTNNATSASYALNATTGAYANTATSASYALNATTFNGLVSSVFATTGSNTFVGTQTISGSVLQSGSFTTTGTIIAQTINVQTVTSSIVYSSGSNVFGNSLGNSQTFTGSVLITGSLTIAGASSATSYSGTTIYGSTVACSPIGCFATSCATSFIGGTMSGTTIYGSTAVCSAVGKFTTCIDAGSGTFSSSVTANRLISSYTSTDPSLSSDAGSGLNLVGNAGVRLNMGALAGSPYNAWIQASNGSGTAYSILLNPLGGNVLIGTTTNDTYKLDVNGTGRFSGNVIASSSTADVSFKATVAGDYFPRLYIERTGGTTKTNRLWSLVIGSAGSFNVTDDTGGTTPLLISTTGAATFSSTITGTTIYGSTAVCSAVGKFTSCIDAGSGTFNGNTIITSTGIGYFNGCLTVGSLTGSGYRLEAINPSCLTGYVNLFYGLHTGNNTFTIKQFGANHPSAASANQIGVLNAEQHLYLVTDTQACIDAGTSTKGIFLKSGGNVGIGIQSPSAKLDVYAGADATSNLVLWGQTIRNEGNGAATGYGAGLKLKISSDGEPYKWAGIAAVAGTGYSNRTDLALYTAATSTANATEKVRITGAGYIGIGTCTPAYSLSVVSGWIHNYGAQNASGFRYENDAAGHVLNLNANNAYAQLYTSTDTSLYFGTSNDIRLKILNTGETCFKCNAYFCGSTYGIMGFGEKVMDKICYIMTTTGTLCVPLDGLTYSSNFPTRAIYLYGTLLDNDSAHYAHMIYFYRNDYGGLQTCTISQSSLVHPSTAGQPFTFSVNDPGSTGKGACTLLLRFTSAGAGVAAGSYCTKMRIVVYNVPGL
jgi:hypothetical protein